VLYQKVLVLFFLFAVFMVAPSVGAQDVLLIVNADVPGDSITASDVKNIFLCKKTDWGNGSKITFFTTEEDATLSVFLKDYVGKSSSQYRTFWKKQVFTGKGKMPQSSGNDNEMVELVSGTGGAIGFVLKGADLGNTKTLSIQ
jgi:ABC-type phosphate transport system substrate-binding protein